MYLVYSLYLISFFFEYRLIIFLVFVIRLGYFKQKRSLTILIIAFCLMSLSYRYLPLEWGKEFTVMQTQPYSVTLRKGFSEYTLKGTHTLEAGDKVQVNNSFEKDNRSLAQKMRRNQGYLRTKEIIKHRKVPSLRNSFWNSIKNYPELESYFSHESDSILSLFTIQLSGILWVLGLALNRLIIDQYEPLWKSCVVVLYGIFFGFRFSIVRILLRELRFSQENQMIILLILYPECARYPGFYIVYLPVLIESLSSRFSVNMQLLRVFIMLRLFGVVYVGEVLCYKLLIPLSGIVSVLSVIGFKNLATKLLKYSISWRNKTRFVVKGKPSLLWGLLFRKEEKSQWLTFIIMLMTMTYYPWMRVTMIDVGQGDAFLITYPLNLYTVLIDTGKPNSYYKLKKVLDGHGVYKLDRLIITHDDLDHNGNEERVFEEYKVEKKVKDKQQTIPFMQQLLQNNEYEDKNDNSLIVYFETYRKNYLMMGDATIIQEKEIIRQYPGLEIDILKLGHHGSNTSSDALFLAHIQPSLALISSQPSVYNHPHPEVMKRLYEYQIPSIETSKEGTVTHIVTRFFDLVVSERNGFGIMK